jgi:hypothetical protein
MATSILMIETAEGLKNAADITKSLAEGWKMIRFTEAALTQWRASPAR